jgi:hypothetical protein
MKLITINEDWPIRVAKHKVLYRKAFPLNELDTIILSFLNLYNDTISYNELGSILGFAVEDNAGEQVYFDIAEAGIFSSLLDTLSEYHLISTHKNEDGKLIITTTQWGLEARLKGKKHLFYEGVIDLNEHYLLFDWEDVDNLFNFSKYGLFSEISNSKEIKPYLVNLEEQQSNILLRKILLNFNAKLEENKYIEIQQINEDILSYEKRISNLSLSLLNENEVYSIQVALNESPSPELDKIISKDTNSNLYADWVLLLRYQLYLRDIKEIQAADISQFNQHVNWQKILSDSRVVWDNNWFKLLSSEDVTSNAVWNQVIQNCPDEVLILNIEAYADYWDWSSLSKKVEIPYIIKTINKFLWDIDVFLERIDQKELEQLLTTITDVNAIEDWKNVTNRVSFEFIESKIQSLPFDLHAIISFGEILSGKIILNNLQLNWDWTPISATYSINYFILNIDTLSPYIDITSVVNRILKNEVEFILSFKDSKFSSFLITSIKKTNFKIGRDQEVILNSETFKFLSDNDLLFWGNENIPGIEANQNLKWSSDLFEKYSSLVKNQAGYDNVSLTIESIDIIEKNETFPWNFRTLCNRKDLKWTFEFIRNHQDKLALNILINGIPSELVADNLAFFVKWATEKELLEVIARYISTEFTFEQILLNRELLNSHNIAINWVSVLREASVESLNEISLSDTDELLQLPSADGLRNHLSKKCELDFILDNPDLFWDWEFLTSQRIDKSKFNNDKFLIKYAKYLFWPFLIKEHYTVEELNPEEKLYPLAILLQSTTDTISVKAWKEITRKIPFNNLILYIEKYKKEQLFHWDWDYISSSKFIPIDHKFLSNYSNKINWKLLSSNNIISSFFQFSKQVYRDTRQWQDRTLEYLYAYKDEWDFKALSSINNITWNERIISEFEEKWDWKVLSAQSPLLTNSNKEKRIIEYDARRLNRFSGLIDWSVLSSRFEVTLYPSLIDKFSNHPWDWVKLSSHTRFELTKEFIIDNSTKLWDFHALSSHKFFKVDKELLLKLPDKDWDYSLLSKASWIDNDTLLTLSDKQWNWPLLSSSNNLIFDLNLLSLFVLQADSNWSNIINSESLHITSEIIKLLVSKSILNNERWDSLSNHQNLDFQQHPQLLTEYKDKWNWGTLIKYWKLDFNDIEMLSEYKDYIEWDLLCNSENFLPATEILLKFKQFLNWKIISGMIVFDINGLRLFKDFLDWESISQNTSINFTIEMIEEFKMYWDYYCLQENIAISNEVRVKLFEIIDSIPDLQFYFKLKQQHSDWSGYIYHFTLLDNAAKILKSKKILSRIKAYSLKFYDSASSQVVTSNFVPHKYARFYFRPQTPYQYYSQNMGKDKNSNENTFKEYISLGRPKCPITVMFKFNLQEIILKKKYGQEFEITTGNAHRKSIKRGHIRQLLNFFNFTDVFSTINNTSDDDWRTYKNYSQQEFLIEDEFNFSEINDFSIIVQTESDKIQLLSRMKSEFEFINNRIIIDDSQKYLHKLNPKINYEYHDSILMVNLLYAFEYENQFYFILEFEKSEKYDFYEGNVLNITDTKITFKSRIKISIAENIRFKILLVDNLKNEICPIFSNSEDYNVISKRIVHVKNNNNQIELVHERYASFD